MQKSNQKIAMLYCMVIGTAKVFLKHMFLTCDITTRLTNCLDTGNRTFQSSLFQQLPSDTYYTFFE